MKLYKRIVLAMLCVCIVATLAAFSVNRQSSALKEVHSANEGAKGVPLPILMYHTVCPGYNQRYIISPAALEKDLQYIKESGYTAITVADLIAYKENDVPLPEKPIMLTFDDGNRTNFIYVFPLLQKYNLKAVFSVVGAYVESPEKNSSVTYEQIIQMRESGLVEIQNHSYDCHKIGKRNGMKPRGSESFEDYEKFISTDLQRFEDNMEKNAGFRCFAVTYPFGAFTKDTVTVLQNLGYKASLICTEGVNYINKNTNLYYLKRYNRDHKRDAETLLR
ncbi:MAG: polysaccharide deacetylase family protein [Firmicutes bacterium]|nr:polysaccharide deacetylase family protein [Bacillota bacterium]